MYHTTFESNTKIWKGVTEPYLFHEDLSLGYLILKMLQGNPNKIGQISHDSGVTLTCNELRLRSIRIAQHILKLNILKQNDVVGIVCCNTENVAPISYASFICGNPLSTLDPRFKEDEISHVFDITKPKLVYCDADNYQTVKKSLEALNTNAGIYIVSGTIPGVPNVTELLQETGREEEFLVPVLEKGGKQIAVILCSSGSTGLPKGVALSHQTVINNTWNFMLADSDSVLFSFSTLYWLTGFVNLVLPALKGATRIITNERFTPELYLKIVEQYQVTSGILPPSSILALLNCADINTRCLRSMRHIVCGGSYCPKHVAESFSKYLENGKFCIAYGATEIGRTCSLEYSETQFDSVGRLGPNIEMKVLDKNGKPLGIGEIGELVVRTKYMFSGYLNNEDATKEVFTNGWLRLGDIGYFDNEGYLRISGRLKAVFKHRGYTVYPAQIESVIITIPGVLNVSVCDIVDKFNQSMPAAAIIKDVNCSLTEDDVAEYVRERMLEYNHLVGGVYFVDSIPMTPSGKNRLEEVRTIVSKIYQSKVRSTDF